MEHGNANGADPQGDEHESQLRHSGIGEHPLDVVLRQRHHAGQQRRRQSDSEHHVGRARGDLEDRQQPRDQVDAGDDHRGGVDQRGDRRRAFHRIGQPDVERDLGRLTGRAEEEHQRREREIAVAHDLGQVVDPARLGGGDDVGNLEGTGRAPEEDDADEQAHVAESRGDERFLGSLDGGTALVVETDQEEGAEADTLPGDEHEQQVVGQDQGEHHRHEEREHREVPPVARLGTSVVTQIVGRIDVDHQRDGRDDKDHHHRDRVDGEAEPDNEAVEVDPVGADVADAAQTGAEPVEVGLEHKEEEHEHGQRRADRDKVAAARELAAEEEQHDEGDGRDRRQNPCVVSPDHCCMLPVTT